ncbi:MAG: hypothetical protein ICV64_06405, partial [Thermoleophilia bacterium]|nr:hypothetical protein [Thermoleophilia bacterium]
MSVEPPPLTVSIVGADAESFRIDVHRTDAGGRDDVAVTVTCTAPEDVSAGVRAELRLGATDDPGWLIPGLFYGENRLAGCTRIYPRWVADGTNVERMEASAWSFRADRAATPAVFAWTPVGGAALVTGEVSPLGESGVGFAYEGGDAVLRLEFPYREEPLAYDGSETPSPPDVPLHRWSPREAAALRFSLYRVGPDRHAYADVLRDVHARAGGGESPAWVSPQEAARLAAWGLYRWHYRPDPPRLLETVGFDRAGDREAMHVSWVSGVPYAYALLRHGRRVGNRAYVEAAEAVLDHVAGNLTPGGTFWAQWTAERGWTTGWHPDRKRLHARTLADAALFMLRAGGRWRDAALSNVRVACGTQREDGALPAAHHVDTGGAVSWEGTAGLAWVPALAEAGELEAARRAGAYYRRFVDAELLYGSPEDVDLAPTSEDGYAAVMAYVALYEHDGDERWLDAARRAADWTLTFRYSYDVAFSPLTVLGHYGFRTRGADQASPANQHLHAFGLICLPEMVRLARHTGDPYYLERTRDNFACFRQFIAREDGDFNAYRGMASERFYQT